MFYESQFRGMEVDEHHENFGKAKPHPEIILGYGILATPKLLEKGQFVSLCVTEDLVEVKHAVARFRCS
jgi:hypothetical protein